MLSEDSVIKEDGMIGTHTLILRWHHEIGNMHRDEQEFSIKPHAIFWLPLIVQHGPPWSVVGESSLKYVGGFLSIHVVNAWIKNKKSALHVIFVVTVLTHYPLEQVRSYMIIPWIRKSRQTKEVVESYITLESITPSDHVDSHQKKHHSSGTLVLRHGASLSEKRRQAN